MNQLAIAVLVTLGGAFVGAAGVANDSPAVASTGWLVAFIGACVAVAFAIRAVRGPSGRV